MSVFGSARDAVEDLLRKALCGISYTAGAVGALFGLEPGTPFPDLGFAGFMGSNSCGTPPSDPGEANLPPPSEFDEGFGWYIFADGYNIDIFTCVQGESIPRRKVAKFDNSYTNVAATRDKTRGVDPPCKYVFGKFLDLTRADGTIQESSFDGPGGVSAKLGGYDIIRYTATGFARQVPPPPPNWNRYEAPVTVSPPSGASFTIPVVAVFAPVTVNVDGTIEIPITVDVGGVTINVTYDASRDEYKYGPSGDGRDYRSGDKPTDLVPTKGSPLPPVPPSIPTPGGTGPNPNKNPSSESVIKGVVVTVGSVSGGITQVPQGGNPDLYLPDLGTVAFATKIGQNSFAWSEPVRIQGLRQYVECPFSSGAVDVAGTPRNGVVWTLTPVESEKTAPNLAGTLGYGI